MIKLKSADYNEETGISTAIIITDLGTFIGTSKLHEEDKDIESKFFGCECAEMRAVIKYAKAKVKIQNIKVETLSNLIENLKMLKGYEKDSLENRQVRKQFFIEEDRLNKYKQKVENLELVLYSRMKNRRSSIEQILNKAAANK